MPLLERLEEVTGRNATELVNEAVAAYYRQLLNEAMAKGARLKAEHERSLGDDLPDFAIMQGLTDDSQ